MGIDNVIGQREAWQRLTEMCREDRLPHAIMLCGPRGCGKMALALAFADYVLSLSEGADGRQQHRLPLTSNPDMHFTYPTIKTPAMGSDYKPTSADFAREWKSMIEDSPYFTMEKWMRMIGAEKKSALITAGESEELTHALSMMSRGRGYKVSLIWLPERMNAECANKMLKLVEEPPHMTVFIMVSEDPANVLETIMSRTQRIDIKRIDDRSMVQALIEKRGLDEDTARRVAHIAAGDWTAAVEMLEADNENTLFSGLSRSLMRCAYVRKVKELKDWAETMQSYDRDKQRRFLTYLLRFVRENFAYNFHDPRLTYMSREEEAFAKNFAPFINEKNVIAITKMAERAAREIAQNANSNIVFFVLAVEMIIQLRK